MEAPGGPLRFKRPLDFSASSFCPGPPFSQEVLQDPAKELWLIRAPANFSPESLDGHSVSLRGFQTLKAPQPGGTEKIFHVQVALEHLGGALVLLPSGQGGLLTCSLPFSGSLSVCETYGHPGGNQLLSPVVARPAPQVPAGLRQRFLPFGGHPESTPLPGAVGEPPRKKMKKMKKKKKRRLGEEEEEEASEERPPLFGMPLGETAGAGEAEARGWHEAAPLAAGSQPGSAAVAQDGILLGEPENLTPLSKKKKKKKKREEEMEAETGHGHEDRAAPLTVDSQPSCTADAQDGLLSGGAEDLAHLSKKKKKKKKKRKEEMGAEAETGHEDREAPPAVDPQLSSAADAQNGLLSGEAEDQAPLSKKKKKRRKEDRGLKEEMGQAAESAARPHEEDSMAWGVLSPEAQPDSAAFAHDSLLSGEAEAAGPGSKKKKKKRKEEMGAEAEAANLRQADGMPPWATGSQPNPAAVAQDEGLGGEPEATHPPREEGAAPWGTGSQPHAGPVAQEGLLSGAAEGPGPQSKKKKRKDRREVKEETGIETEAALPSEENGTTPWETGSQPNSGLLAQDSLLSGEAEGPASVSKKKKKKKRKEEAGEAEGLLGLSSWPGRDSLPGVEEVAQGTHEEAVPPEPFSSRGDAAGVWRDFSGPGPGLEGELVLVEEEQEQPGAGSSSHKAKKKKRKKEKEEPEERPAQQGAEGWAELGAPLGGGGGGQEAEPSGEELSRKRKKKEHRRQQAAEEERLAGLEEEVGNP